MKLRNITIGLTDGLTIPFALAAGLSGLVNSSHTILTACIIVSIAGAFTMTLGSYAEAKKYEPSKPLLAALTIGLSYIAGGLISISPYFFINNPFHALRFSSVITLTFLFISGYYDSKLNGANGWRGAFRIMITGLIAAMAAFAIAKLFR